MLLTMLSILFLFMKHPMTMGMMLLLTTTTLSLITGKLMMNFWFSYIMFLVMVGGLLILFIYMTSLTSNKKFSNFKLKILLLLVLPMMIMSYDLEKLDIQFEFMNKMKFINSLNKFVNFPANMIYLMIITYLLITLIAIIKITMKLNFPLRIKN
nr:NADH dehydrogenase subunit 6 [Microrhagus sp. ZM-2022]